MEISDTQLIQNLIDNLEDTSKCEGIQKSLGSGFEGFGYFSNCLLDAMASTGVFQVEQLSEHVCNLAHTQFVQNFDIECFEGNLGDENQYVAIEHAMNSTEWRNSLINLAQQFADVKGMNRVLDIAREFLKRQDDTNASASLHTASDTPLPGFMFKLGEAISAFFGSLADSRVCMQRLSMILRLCNSQLETLSCILLLREMMTKYTVLGPVIRLVLSSALLHALYSSPNYNESTLSFFLLKCGVPMSVSNFYAILTQPSRDIVVSMYQHFQASIALTSHIPGQPLPSGLKSSFQCLFDKRSIDLYPLSTLQRLQRDLLMQIYPHFDSKHPVSLEELQRYPGVHPACTRFLTEYKPHAEVLKWMLLPSHSFSSPSFVQAVASVVVQKSVRIPQSQKESISHGIHLLVLLHTVQHYEHRQETQNNTWLHDLTTGARKCLNTCTELITHIQTGQSYFLTASPALFLHTYSACLHVAPVAEQLFAWVCTFLTDTKNLIYPNPVYIEYFHAMVVLLDKLISVDPTKTAAGISVLYTVYSRLDTLPHTQTTFLADALVNAIQMVHFPTSSARVLASVPSILHPVIGVFQWILDDVESPKLFILFTRLVKAMLDILPSTYALTMIQLFLQGKKYESQKAEILPFLQLYMSKQTNKDDLHVLRTLLFSNNDVPMDSNDKHDMHDDDDDDDLFDD